MVVHMKDMDMFDRLLGIKIEQCCETNYEIFKLFLYLLFY